MHAELTGNNYSKSPSKEKYSSVIVTEDKNDHIKDQGGMLNTSNHYSLKWLSRNKVEQLHDR